MADSHARVRRRTEATAPRFDSAPRDASVRPMFDAGATRDQSLSPSMRRAPHPASPSDATIFQPGELIGARYRVVRFLARGGMGEVYEAVDLELDLRLAVKTIRAERASHPDSIERLKREILAARRVSHPNVVRLFDVGFHVQADQHEIAFITMELLVGETLDAYLRRVGPLGPEAAAPLVAQLAAALDVAHAAGVVHRDFKSQNVILLPAPASPQVARAVVTDFGLAESGADLEGSAGVTTELVGTPAYMAPEQVSRRYPVTHAADIYALGVVMFEMVTGRRPFVAETALATAVRRIEEPAPSPRLYAHDLPAAWEQTILRCLEREPAARFASGADVVGALSLPTRRRPRLGWRTGSLLAAGLLACAALVWLLRPARPAPVQQVLPAPGEYELVRAGNGKCLEVDRSGSANGTQIQQWPCNGSTGQVFRLEAEAKGTFRLVNPGSNKCVDIYAGGAANGTNIQLWDCDNTAAQSFRLESLGDDRVRFRHIGSKKCLTVDATLPPDGANVELWPCDQQDTQAWAMRRVGS